MGPRDNARSLMLEAAGDVGRHLADLFPLIVVVGAILAILIYGRS